MNLYESNLIFQLTRLDWSSERFLTLKRADRLKFLEIKNKWLYNIKKY